MWELFHILPIILGEDIPPGDNHYECFMKLQSISAIVFSPAIALDPVPLLQLEIRQYLEEFKAMYPQRKLTPKDHYLVHIPALINRYLICIKLSMYIHLYG